MSLRRLILLASMAAMLVAGIIGTSMPVANAQDASPEAAAPQLPVTVTDVNGNSIDVTDISRIIPLNGNVAETLFALGLGPNVVAVDISATYPAEAAALPKIGYQRELSAEGILSFEPTLVIGTQNAGPEDVIQQVRDAGVPVIILPVQMTAAGAAEEVRAIGAAVGLAEEAEALAAMIDARVAETAALVEGVETKPRVAFLYIRGEGTQMIAGAGNQADAIITAAGGINVGTEIGIEGYQPITPEALVEAQPDYILVMQAGLASVGGVEGLLSIPGVKETPAGENGAIIAFDDQYLLGFGPRIGDAVYDLTLALYPDIEGAPIHPGWQGTDVVTPEASPAA